MLLMHVSKYTECNCQFYNTKPLNGTVRCLISGHFKLSFSVTTDVVSILRLNFFDFLTFGAVVKANNRAFQPSQRGVIVDTFNTSTLT